MKKKKSSLVMLCCVAVFWGLAVSAPSARALVARERAQAAGTPFYACTSDFALARVRDGYRFTGTLDVPTPGYIYKMSAAALQEDGGIAVTLNLVAPMGPVVQLISHVQVDTIIPPPLSAAPVAQVQVFVKKPFKWGPEAITCKLAGMTQ
ncbi:MAG: hypothetical protein GC185_05100 [Alphaproteobacteria bacterium]|nr:hypothetical protein [Alphaproteobacteria bacterium]